MTSDVRRSDRIKLQLNGFKSAQCSDKNCFACSSSPPTLSAKVIKLGKDFCKVAPEELSDAALGQKKKGKSGTISKPGNNVPQRPKQAVTKKKASAKDTSSSNGDKDPKKKK